MAEIHETIDSQVIPIDNIDYIGQIERPYTWGFKVYLKSGREVWVSKNDSYNDAYTDRKLLIEKLKVHTISCE